MAYSSTYPALTAHLHSVVPGDGGSLSGFITVVDNVKIDEDIRRTSGRTLVGIAYDLLTNGGAVSISVAMH